jgi:hypothetical protein
MAHLKLNGHRALYEANIFQDYESKKFAFRDSCNRRGKFDDGV